MGGICWAIPLTVTITRVPDFRTSVFREIIMFRSGGGQICPSTFYLRIHIGKTV